MEKRIDSAFPHRPFFLRDFHFHSILTTVKRNEERGGARCFSRDDANRLGGTIGGGGERERLVLSPAASVHARVMAGNGLVGGGRVKNGCGDD